MAGDRVPAVIRGGKHDGLEGAVAPAVIEAGFLPVMERGPDGEGMVYGYELLADADDEGRRVFVPNGSRTQEAR